jgi:uncharacterized protein YjbI with pentapeptide repeats
LVPGGGRGQARRRCAELSVTDLSGADLIHADLSGADLIHADLSGAERFRADLSEALGLAQPQLDAAHGDRSTQLSKGLQRPDSWATGEESAPVSS